MNETDIEIPRNKSLLSWLVFDGVMALFETWLLLDAIIDLDNAAFAAFWAIALMLNLFVFIPNDYRIYRDSTVVLLTVVIKKDSNVDLVVADVANSIQYRHSEVRVLHQNGRHL